MSKYIEVDKLIAEIERWRDKAKEKYNESTYSMGRCDALAEFRNHIVSLQPEQTEADLDREIIKYKVPFTGDRECLHETTLDAIARHFAEWGAIHLNARKEEQ